MFRLYSRISALLVVCIDVGIHPGCQVGPECPFHSFGVVVVSLVRMRNSARQPEGGRASKEVSDDGYLRTCGGGEHGRPRKCRPRFCERAECRPTTTLTPGCPAGAVPGEGEWRSVRWSGRLPHSLG